MHQGQICMSVGRIIVEKPIVEEFAGKLAEKAASLPAGDPTDPGTVIGPLINDEQVAKVDTYVKDAVSSGAKLLAGGTFEGRVYSATVLSNITRDMRAWQEEIFGPVAPVLAVGDEKEALEVANDTMYGLSAGVVTKDLEKAIYLAEGLESGMVHVNDASIDAEASVPFGGSKWSGQGREGGRYSLDALTEMKWVTIQKQKRSYPF
jgi:acyl-CoA reductase-like NAD-dependent aldehyde dehydrogenase